MGPAFRLLITLLTLAGLLPPASPAAEKKKIVLVAGLKSHGPEGNGIHDYGWSSRLIKTMLENSNVRDQVEVSLYLNGWPHDAQLLRQADAVMILSDGRDGHLGREAPHLATDRRVRQLEEMVARRCGIITFHFSTFAPDALAEQALHWYGGYFDWEHDGQRDWYSDITTIEAEVTPASPTHPILRGVRPFTIQEEFYYDIRFAEEADGWVPIWSVAALPKTKPRGDIVAWAVQRDGGGRGFATTCGHFYANWQEADFRKTVLNGLAWAAQISVPAGGVESDYFTHEEIARHLGEAGLVARTEEEAAEDSYADDPYWYRPGHPIEPAEAGGIKTLPGFAVDKILTVPEEWGSWTAITVDPHGRLICAAQHKPGLYRVTPPAASDPSSPPKVEKLTGAAEQMGWSHGLLAALDSLFVTVTEENTAVPGGVYRLRDTDGDDQYDELRQILKLELSGEHGPHNIVVGPDQASLYMICGNGTSLPDGISRYAPSRTSGVDHLMPPGFDSSEYAPGGFVLRFRPDGGDLELVCGGLRNSFDLAFNHDGDLFTFDSDMEWDLGAPWYRPTRICHLVSGAEFGWRGDAAKWPEYFADSVAAVLNVGPSSPTGVVFGYDAKFPVKYQRALYACDWTFATIYAIHLEPHGASYRGKLEEFVGGSGLPVTDLTVGADGAIYFVVGGRRLGSALYRVRYTGPESTQRAAPPERAGPLPELRRRLEQFHGVRNEDAVRIAWPLLAHDDRAVRFAARVAVESQSVDAWRQRVYAETHPRAKLVAMIALARQDAPAKLGRIIENLNAIDPAALSADQLLEMLRTYELALARGGDQVLSMHGAAAWRLSVLLPHRDPRVNRELARLLCYLEEPAAIEPLLQLMAGDEGQRPTLGTGAFVRNQKYDEAIREMLQAAPLVDRMHHAQMLLWIAAGWTADQRVEYFSSLADAAEHSGGGHWYREFWNRIRETALGQVLSDERQRYAAIGAAAAVALDDENLPAPRGPGRPWKLDELLEAVSKAFRNRDFDDGKRAFSAARCISCHRFNGEGSSVGPDLSSIGQRFTLRDILDATLNPSKAVSDQYRVSILLLDNGRTLSGRVLSRDQKKVTVATDLRRPSQTTSLDASLIESESLTPISTMPVELLGPLNLDEILNLLAYLVSGGDEFHPVFRD